MSTVSYQVERRRPVEVEAELCRVWADNLTLESTAAAKFAWLYRDAPEPATTVLMLLARGGDGDDGGPAVVGTAGVGVRRFEVAGAAVRAALMADLAVDRAHRSVAPALALVREGKACALAEHALAYGFPNKLAEGVFARAGYRRLGTIERHVRVLRHADYLDRVGDAELARVPVGLRPATTWVLRQPAGRALAAAGLDVLALGRQAGAVVGATRQLALRWGADVDERIDHVWARARVDYPVVATRTARFLAWRFFARPGCTLVLACERAGGAPVAYAVVETVEGHLHLRDLFGTRAGVLGLLDRLPAAAYRRGARSLSIRYLGQPWLATALATRGFIARGGGRAIVVAAGPSLPAAAAAEVTDVTRWHLTDADEDV